MTSADTAPIHGFNHELTITLAMTAVRNSLSAAGFAAIDFTGFYNALMVPVAMVMFFIVFLASNAINMLILLSPFPRV